MTAIAAFRSATALAAGLLLVAACTSEPSTPPPSAGTTTGGVTSGGALPPPAAGENTSGGSLPVAPSAPVPEAGGAPAATSDESGATTGEPVIVQGPDGTTWAADPRTSQEIYQADIEDCYRYATAQTRRDARYIDDRNAGIDTLTNDSVYSGLRQRVDEYDLRNRRSGLMSSCMESKGYARADTVLPRLEF